MSDLFRALRGYNPERRQGHRGADGRGAVYRRLQPTPYAGGDEFPAGPEVFGDFGAIDMIDRVAVTENGVTILTED